ncbi:MAG: hypothetical protein ABI693_15470 [Bryobacteraceae bacterium]
MRVRSIAERFSTPHSFNPDLTPAAAAVAVVGALTRIVLGSLLFALWGVSAALLWNAIPNPFWEWTALVFMVLLFLVALAALMIAISAAVKALTPK